MPPIRGTARKTTTTTRAITTRDAHSLEDECSFLQPGEKSAKSSAEEENGRGRLAFQIMHLQPSLHHLVNAALERSHPRLLLGTVQAHSSFAFCFLSLAHFASQTGRKSLFFFPFRFSLVLNGQPRGSPANTLPARNFHGSPLVRPLSTLFHGAVGEKGQDGQGFVGGFGNHGAGGKEGGWKREIGAGAAANNTPPARVGKPALWTSFGRRFAPKQTFAPCKRKHVLGGDRMQRGVVLLQEEVSE